jgi:opacity protein-like surface antigen
MPIRRTTAMRISVALSACLLLTAVAAAADPKPIISTKSKSAEITVSIDDALKAHPGLYDNLLSEGRREAAKWRAEADDILRKGADPMTFKDGRRYDYSRSYTQRSVVGRYVSVLRSDGAFTGGAHPNSYTDTILWDRDAKTRISIRPFFKETADKGPAMTALAKLVRAAVHAEKKRKGIEVEGTPDTDDWLKGVEPSLLKLGPVTLAPSAEAGKSAGLTFHFSPYMVGPYAEGPLTVFVPWTDFKDSLSPEGVALFGGTRAKGDAETFE